MENKILYLDSNSHRPIHPKALEAFIKFNSLPAAHGHPSALNAAGRAANAALEEAREKIAKLIGAKNSNQIIFTSGCTNACDWGLKILFNIGKYNKKEIVVSSLEHPAVGKICETEDIQQLKSTKDGIIIQDERVKKLICLYVQNEIGTIQPIKELKADYIFSDMSQALGKIPVNVTDLNIDIATFGAHKFGGISGVGFIYLKDINNWIPYNNQIHRYMDSPGTLNVAGIVASAVALEEAINSLPERTENMKSFQKTLENELLNMGFEIIGYNASRSPSTTYFAGLKFSQKTILDLSEKEIFVGSGSACSSGISGFNAIPTMKALDKDYHLGQVMRISTFGEYISNDAAYFIKVLKEVL